jgi:16S rRNA (adenine1518-N6/adenine1519-N6)-dimethyltransferase
MTSDDLLRPSVLKELCARAGIRPDRKSGQNFLVNRTTLDRIVAAVDPKPDDTILEVGAGFGVLTCALAQRLKDGELKDGEQRGRVIAVERDRRITPILRELVMEYEHVAVMHDDILRMLRVRQQRGGGCHPADRKAREAGTDRSDATSDRERPSDPSERGAPGRASVSAAVAPPTSAAGAFGFGRQFKIVANLPYSITSDFLRLLFDRVADGSLPPPERAVLLLQREVVDRLTADSGKASDRHAVGLLTILTQLQATPRRIVRVPSSHFWPIPKVESAVVVLEKWRTPEEIAGLLGGPTRVQFLSLVRTCFAHRRRQIGRLLRGHSSSLKPEASSLKSRPEELTLEQWIALVRAGDIGC